MKRSRRSREEEVMVVAAEVGVAGHTREGRVRAEGAVSGAANERAETEVRGKEGRGLRHAEGSYRRGQSLTPRHHVLLE
ncbi:hypothetical protein E2C01_065017 [Portunus trituberculatus]|uniref:Uncharacterized protein n=1 Tax=Portunus trituberculatus TaxID=210409 RepID=A0A5B7HDD2_PORTR|nr:hypothetical protein [Portunus trituberculatus]